MSKKPIVPARKRKRIVTNSPQETKAWGAKLAALFNKGDIICLVGDLGSGKTTLVQGIAQGLKIKEAAVNSPTFVLLNSYEGRLPLYHFDLYRLEEASDILNLGYEEFFYGQGLSVIEWADKLGKLFPKDCLTIRFSVQNENERCLQLSAAGTRSQEILKHVL